MNGKTARKLRKKVYNELVALGLPTERGFKRIYRQTKRALVRGKKI